jgi:hypothetical protein
VRCTGPFGRGTERELVVEPGSDGVRELNPLGGRGTLWFIAICEFSPRVPAEVEGRGTFDEAFPIRVDELLPRLCGGRGTKRPAGAGVRIFSAFAAVRFAGVVFARGTEDCALRLNEPSLARVIALRDAAGGVMRLNVP